MEMKDFLATRNGIFDASVILFDIVGSTTMEDLARYARTRSNFQSFLSQEIEQSFPSSDAIAWYPQNGDSGFIVADPSSPDITLDKLIRLGDRLLRNLISFNRDRVNANQLPFSPIRLKLICGSGSITNPPGNTDPNNLTSDILNNLSHMEKFVGLADHLVIYPDVFEVLSPEIRGRLRTIALPGGEMPVLDGHVQLAGITSHLVTEAGLRQWVKGNLREDRRYIIRVFAYTNEESAASMVDWTDHAEVRVLLRNWIDEEKDERDHKLDIPLWSKSGEIQRWVDTFGGYGPGVKVPTIRFYHDRPWLQGVIISDVTEGSRLNQVGDQRTLAIDHDNKSRRAMIGIYGWNVNHENLTSPIYGAKSPYVQVFDDYGLQSTLLDTIQSRFDQLWSAGSGPDELHKTNQERQHKERMQQQPVWDTTAKNYLLVIAGRIIPQRADPVIAAEDALGAHDIESMLRDYGITSEWLVTPQGDELQSSDWNKIIQFQGNIVFLCRHTVANRQMAEIFAQQGMPFSFGYSDIKGKEVPAIEDAIEDITRTSPMDRENPSERDYCLIAKIKSPISDRYWYAIAGIHGMGTFGGCKYMVDPQKLSDDIWHSVDSGEFAALLACDFEKPIKVKAVRAATPIYGKEFWMPVTER